MSITCFKNQFNGFGHRNLKPSFGGCLMQIHQGTPLCHRSTFSLCIFQCHPVEATGLLRVVSHGCVYFRKELMRSYPCWITCFTSSTRLTCICLPPSLLTLPQSISTEPTSLRAFFSALGASKAWKTQGENQTKTAPKATRWVLEAMFENIANGTQCSCGRFHVSTAAIRRSLWTRAPFFRLAVARWKIMSSRC